MLFNQQIRFFQAACKQGAGLGAGGGMEKALCVCGGGGGVLGMGGSEGGLAVSLLSRLTAENCRVMSSTVSVEACSTRTVPYSTAGRGSGPPSALPGIATPPCPLPSPRPPSAAHSRGLARRRCPRGPSPAATSAWSLARRRPRQGRTPARPGSPARNMGDGEHDWGIDE